jgi:hypothetical protein
MGAMSKWGVFQGNRILIRDFIKLSRYPMVIKLIASADAGT